MIHRGLERRRLFKSAADVDRVVGAHADLPSRFAVRVYAYVLLPKHYHLLIQTPQANLSQALQWLNVSDSVWFKRQHRRVGPLFQGRFKAILVAPDGPLLQVSRHLHRKPVRTRRFYAARIRPQKGDEASRHERGAPPARLGRSS